MIHMVRNLREATVDDRKSQPRDQKAASPTTAGKSADNAAGKAAGPSADCTDYGQAAGSPGGRGGTTCYGGIQRIQPRTQPAAPASSEKKPGSDP
ncbi:hypothetical protein ABMY26_18245 [Azospirillum sp. HJ39]|uniref:hypothetical protein n=1 Tax=Azospirillum sp. HJ39 TaxID=3159496 RepID=UPI0035570D6A